MCIRDRYKGIPGSSPRTVSLWIKTSDSNGTILSWGADGVGEKWELALENGRLKLGIGGGAMLGKSMLNDDKWNHVAVSLPMGSPLLSDSSLYLNGEIDPNSSSQFNLTPKSVNPDIWLDSSDATTMDKGTSVGALGNPTLGEEVHYWADKSGTVSYTHLTLPTILLV